MLQGMTQTPDIKPRSRDVTDGLEKTAARGMLRAVGMGDDDWVKPQIGVASSWNEITPVQPLARPARQGGQGRRARGRRLPARVRHDLGLRRHLDGPRGDALLAGVAARSSPTRVETVMKAERLDGSVLLAGCDKSLPGMLMAAARLDLAAVFLYAGSILPGVAKLSDGTEKTSRSSTPSRRSAPAPPG